MTLRVNQVIKADGTQSTKFEKDTEKEIKEGRRARKIEGKCLLISRTALPISVEEWGRDGRWPLITHWGVLITTPLVIDQLLVTHTKDKHLAHSHRLIVTTSIYS